MDPEGPQGRIIQIDEGLVKRELGEVVRETVEETLNRMLDAEADDLVQSDPLPEIGRQGGYPGRDITRGGLETKAGKVKLKVPKLRTIPFESAIIDRYKRRESSVEEDSY